MTTKIQGTIYDRGTTKSLNYSITEKERTYRLGPKGPVVQIDDTSDGARISSFHTNRLDTNPHLILNQGDLITERNSPVEISNRADHKFKIEVSWSRQGSPER